ncbi:LysM peptidoglycan-binding domain-containing protein [Pleomorphovibrio marinus]|uniref:LysM peptidoglycan-binding domain-containing protein n=1 Tax=Pleomorphovibrio marinus TaxID=2164132 RepID=UPI0018E4EDD6|nr:LysM peptidoglycan-binding domain-containing protein [Pleomorphovibrio marinus]
MSRILFRGISAGLLILISTLGYSMELSSIDSVGIEKIGEKTYIIHEVKPQETLFGISRRYSTPVNEIVQSNESLKDGLKVGQKIRVPHIEKEAIPPGAVLHHVAPGETMYSIAKKYEVKLDEIMAWNRLQGNDLSIGQGLIIQGVAEKEDDPEINKEKVEETAALGDQKVAVTKKDIAPKKEAEKHDTPKPVSEREKEKAEKQPSKNLMPPPAASSKSDENAPSSSEAKATSSTGGWVSHKVDQGETLFSIAKKYEAKVEDLITWNGLSSNNLSVGQTLKVGREKGANIPVTRFPTNAPPSSEDSRSTKGATSPTPSTAGQSSQASEKPKPVSVSSSTEFKNISETGQAEVIEGTGNHKKYLVLHRTAPVGTIMRIRNEENDVTIFARVVGTLPETGDNGKLVIKVSKAAYDQLRAVNARFPVEIGY